MTDLPIVWELRNQLLWFFFAAHPKTKSPIVCFQSTNQPDNPSASQQNDRKNVFPETSRRDFTTRLWLMTSNRCKQEYKSAITTIKEKALWLWLWQFHGNYKKKIRDLVQIGKKCFQQTIQHSRLFHFFLWKLKFILVALNPRLFWSINSYFENFQRIQLLPSLTRPP